MRRVEGEYYDKELFIHRNNLRKSVEIMKEVINQKKKIDMPDRFNIGGATITDKYAIAQQFNNFYVNIGNNLSKDIPANGGDPISYISSVIPDSIFLESVDSKILEKLMYKRISNFIHKHDLLYEYQFGFRQHRSTNQTLIVLLDKITAALDNGDSVLGVFLDFSKAFDTVDHRIL